MSCCNGNSILNKIPSLIGAPVCVPACPPSGYGCADIIFSDCVTYTGPNLTCVSGNTGDTLTQVLINTNTAVCNSSGSIIEITNQITNIINNITNISGEIASCLDWNIIGPSGSIGDGNFLDNASNTIDFGPYPIEPAAFSEVKNCRVTLKGFVRFVMTGDGPSGVFPIFTLPVGYRPANMRVFPTVFEIEGSNDEGVDGNQIAAFIYIFDTGVVAIGWNGRCCAFSIIDIGTVMNASIENISFDI